MTERPRATVPNADGKPAGLPAEAPPERRISLPFEVYALATRLGAYLDVALAETGIRPAEYALYSLMLEAGPRTPTELAAALGVPPSTLSTYLSALIARGDAHRVPHPTDGRSVRVVLTDQGRGVVRRVNPAFTRADRAITANLDRPEPEVREALAAIAGAIERAARDLHPTEAPWRPEAPSRRDEVTDTSSS
jgi:DNA-binding MarR family transcriptional regulator